MRVLILAAAACVAPLPCATVLAQTATTSAPAATTASKAPYNTTDTEVGALLDDPAARAIVDKNIPGFSAGDQIDMARSMTLKSLQQYAPDRITDQVLAQIDQELAKLPVKK